MDWYSKVPYCEGLNTKPVPEIGTILVAGATGYVGGRLVPELIGRGYKVRVMVMSYSKVYLDRWPDAEIVVADALKPKRLRKALNGVSLAYYLIHSMLASKHNDRESDLIAAANFRKAAEEEKLDRIIYLGAMGDCGQKLSNHFSDRLNVAKTLSEGKVPTTILRAALIFGSGSASFEILENIVRNSPVYFIPYWANRNCQPIGIRDVIKYLVGVIETKETTGNTYDIGSDDILSYREMIKILAKLLRKWRPFLPSPVPNIRFNSYIVSLISPVPAQIVACLMEVIKNEVVVQDDSIRKLIDFKTIRFKVILLRALSREQQDKISTRWSDAYPPAHELSMQLSELSRPPKLKSVYSIITVKEASVIFESICQIGGKRGWFTTSWMWRMRGRIDRIFLGVGTLRGRRSADSLRINDVIDFWRVEDMIPDKRLLLRAEMRLPGKAWLEFKIEPHQQHNKLIAIAYFQPRGIAGRLYWYNFWPFHYFIFKDLLKQLS